MTTFECVRHLDLAVPVTDLNTASYFLGQVGLLINLDINVSFGRDFLHRGCFLHCSLHQREILLPAANSHLAPQQLVETLED